MEKVIGRHTGVPSFFRGCCLEASRGGKNSYADAAWHLAIHVGGSQIPDDVDDDEWGEQVDKLTDLCAGQDGDGVWRWFTDHYPGCMELVPGSRKQQFVAGVLQAYEDDRIDY